MWWILFMSFLVAGGAHAADKLKPIKLIPKIIGGHETTIEKYPFAVQLFSYHYENISNEMHTSVILCGGSIISSWHVLTAAHCLSDWITKTDENQSSYEGPAEYCPTSIYVRVGSATLDEGRRHEGAAVFLHPNYEFIEGETYESSGAVSDVGILMVATAISYSSKVQPAKLPPQNQRAPENAMVKIIGWGTTNEEIPVPSSVLLETTVPIVSLKECFSRYSAPGNLFFGKQFHSFEGIIFCAGLLGVGGKDICYGDSGGPVILGGVVIGTSSFGVACGSSEFPAAYCEISSFTNWIYDVVLATTPNGSPHTSQLSLLTFRCVFIHILSLALIDVPTT